MKSKLILILLIMSILLIGIGSMGFISAVGTYNNYGFAWNSSVFETNGNVWLDFDGNNDYVNLGNNSLFNFSNPYSIQLLFNNFGQTTSQTVLFSKVKNNLFFSEITLRTNINSKGLSLTIGNGTSGYFLNSQSGQSLLSINNTWNNVILTFNGSQYKIYINGFYDSTKIPTGIYSSNANMSLGKKGEISTGDIFRGSMSDFRFYNYTLNYTEVNSVFYNSSSYNKFFSDTNTYVPVLYFHDVSNASQPNWEQGWNPIDPEVFDTFMNYLNESNYTTITMTQLKNYSLGEINYTKPIVLIFDDGYKGVYTYAYPIMKKYDFVGNLAITTEHIENSSTTTQWFYNSTYNEIRNNVSYMNWTNLQELQNDGWEILSHGINHTQMISDYRNNNIPPNATDIFIKSKQSILGNLSKEPISFVFPFNGWNSSIMEECNDYYLICTATDGNGYFILNNTKLNNGEFNRKGILGDIKYGHASLSTIATTLETFIEMLSKLNLGHSDLTIPKVRLKMEENYGTTLFDSYSNINGIIQGNTWRNNITYFKNINSINEHINFNSLTSSLLHNSTSICNGSSSTISENTGNINITLNPNQACYVLDNFNLTEGVIRENSPIWISSTSSFFSEAYDTRTYHLASNISDSLNLTVVITAVCPQTGDNIRFTSKSGDSSYLVNDYSCSNGQIFMNLTDLEQSSSSNTILITYNKDPQAGGGGGGSGTTTPSSNLSTNVSLIVCNDTYESALKNPKDYSQIRNLLLKNMNENYTSIKNYIDHWQLLCSDLINRTLYPTTVCKEVFNLFNETGGNITNKNISDLENKIDKLVPISNYLLTFYIENYKTVCSDLGYSNEFKEEIIFYNENKCNPLLPAIFEASMDFLYIDISNYKCSSINYLNSFFEITGFNEQYKLIGIRIYVLFILGLLIFGSIFLFKRRKK